MKLMTCGEVQAYIKSGALLTKEGFKWHDKWSIAEKQINTFSYIRGLQAQIRSLEAWNSLYV